MFIYSAVEKAIFKNQRFSFDRDLKIVFTRVISIKLQRFSFNH